MTAQRVGGTVLARRLTGAPEAWVRVEKFTADVRDALDAMRDTAESLSAKHAGDVIAFRLSAPIPARGRGVFYWYASPTMGVVEIPPASPDWGNADVTKASRGRDWLSCWTVSTHPGWMLEALLRVSRPDAERAVVLLIERSLATAERYARAKMERVRGNSTEETRVTVFLAGCQSERVLLAESRAQIVDVLPLRDVAAAWGNVRASLCDVDRPVRVKRAAREAFEANPSTAALAASPEFMSLAGRGAVFDTAATETVRRIMADEIRADVPLGALLPRLAERATRAGRP